MNKRKTLSASIVLSICAAAISGTVTHEYIASDGGVGTLEFNVQFKRLSADERKSLAEDFQANHQAFQDNKPPVRTDLETAKLVLAGWDYVDVNGSPVPCIPSSIQELSEQIQGLEHSIVRAFLDQAWDVGTVKAAAAKNSQLPSTS